MTKNIYIHFILSLTLPKDAFAVLREVVAKAPILTGQQLDQHLRQPYNSKWTLI